MPRTCIRFFALLLLLLVAVPALQAAPLLREGKKTLYQRVVSHPGAMPLKEARDGAPAAREALCPLPCSMSTPVRTTGCRWALIPARRWAG